MKILEGTEKYLVSTKHLPCDKGQLPTLCECFNLSILPCRSDHLFLSTSGRHCSHQSFGLGSLGEKQ